jgi:hypothetical protein
LNRNFKKEEQIAKKTHEEILNTPGYKEIQIKITLNFHLISARMVAIKKASKTNVF